jgi:hypothetical protein
MIYGQLTIENENAERDRKALESQRRDIGFVTIPRKKLRELRERLNWIDGLDIELLRMIEEMLA